MEQRARGKSTTNKKIIFFIAAICAMLYILPNITDNASAASTRYNVYGYVKDVENPGITKATDYMKNGLLNNYLVVASQSDIIPSHISDMIALVGNGYTYLSTHLYTRPIDGLVYQREVTGDSIDLSHVTGGAIVIAYFIPSSYTVTFDPNGGTVSQTNMIVTYNSAYGTLPLPTRYGYTFAGWFTGSGGTGTLITNATAVAIASDHTLFAAWTPKQYTVSFDAQGGTVSPTIKEVIYTSQYGNLPVPMRTGYTFTGWYTDVGGNGAVVMNTTTVTTPMNHTLFAS